jgi:hypothetical protein
MEPCPKIFWGQALVSERYSLPFSAIDAIDFMVRCQGGVLFKSINPVFAKIPTGKLGLVCKKKTRCDRKRTISYVSTIFPDNS